MPQKSFAAKRKIEQLKNPAYQSMQAC